MTAAGDQSSVSGGARAPRVRRDAPTTGGRQDRGAIALPLLGAVVRFDEKRKVGYIAPDQPDPALFDPGRDAFFHASVVLPSPSGVEHIQLLGKRVRFCLNFKRGSKDKPMAFRVQPLDGEQDVSHRASVDGKSEREIDGVDRDGNGGVSLEDVGNRGRPHMSRSIGAGDPGHWKSGEVFYARGEVVKLFGRDDGSEYFMFRDRLSKHTLPPEPGDTLNFTVAESKDGRVRVNKARPTRYAARTVQQVADYIDNLEAAVQTMDVTQLALDLVPYAHMWEFLAKWCVDRLSASKLLSLLRILATMLRQGPKLDSSAVLDALAGCGLSRAVQITSESNLTGQRAETLRDFLKVVIDIAPQHIMTYLPIFSILQENQRLDMSLVKWLCLKLTGASGGSNSRHWQCMDMAPDWNEILGNPLHKDVNLGTVSTSFYSNPDHYMETYFRLVRVELFSAIQRGISDLKRGRLDQRDMSYYHGVTVSAITVSANGVNLGLSFNMDKPVKNWERSPKLMFGNLLCISPNQQFDDIIWAVITHRDPKLLKKRGIIMVELCSFNARSEADILILLQANAGNSVMVESPTYFRSLWPVMTSLRDFDMDSFSLGRRIVQGDFAPARPRYTENRHDGEESDDGGGESDQSYLSDSSPSEEDERSHCSRGSALQGLLRRRPRASRRDFETRREKVVDKRRGFLRPMDDAQQEAFEFCLDNDVAIVQGPPGCGKTFLGTRLMETILEWHLDRPVLVMTYKNHALDEFLKHCIQLPNCGKEDVVRIGSRSKEPELESCSLSSAIFAARDGLHHDIKKREMEADYVGNDIKGTLTDVFQASAMDEGDILVAMSEKQLQKLVLSVDWARIGNGKMSGSWISQTVLPNVKKNFGHLSTFVRQRGYGDKSGYYGAFLTALTKWMPSREKIRELRILQQQCATDTAPGQSNDGYASEDKDSEDEELIEEMQNERQSGMSDSKKDKLMDKALFLPKEARKRGVVEMADFPTNMSTNYVLLGIEDVWTFSEAEKMQLLFTMLKTKLEELKENLADSLKELKAIAELKSRIDLSRRINACKNKKVIGATITGASINHELIHTMSPQVVIVEEAGEILEPSLLAALHPKVQHLIMIGDHKQLRPQVETYDLVKEHRFDISMMERLVKSKAPFKSLKTQNRMRPEFSALMKDIYPELQDNLERVGRNEAPACLEKCMFFWSHNFLEDGVTPAGEGDRTKKNTGEAEMVMALALFLLQNGHPPSKVTILAGYSGQLKLLRQIQKESQRRYPHLFTKEDQEGEVESIQVQTVDMFQGDENDVVIVSLTRGNKAGQLGFFAKMNRRCVAQSRARCGMYFVGNMAVFESGERGKSVWKPLIQSMQADGYAGPVITVQCVKHGRASRRKVATAGEMMSFIESPGKLCNIPCGKLYPCLDPKHVCKKSCSPPPWPRKVWIHCGGGPINAAVGMWSRRQATLLPDLCRNPV